MRQRYPRFFAAFDDMVSRDAARPIELTFLALLLGWAQFLIVDGEVFQAERYKAFAFLQPGQWAAIILVVIAAQLASFWPARWSPIVRAIAMAMVAGQWTIIAALFLSTGSAPILSRTFGILAAVAVVAGLNLGIKAFSNISWRR